jgi:hypothetical protein
MCSQHVPLSDQKEAPYALLKVHYVSTRALAAFKGGDFCLVLVYKATFVLLFGPPNFGLCVQNPSQHKSDFPADSCTYRETHFVTKSTDFARV